MWMHRRGAGGARALSPAARRRRDDLVAALRRGLRAAADGGRRVARAPLWLDIDCAKINHRMDALNVLDLVADAVQIATGVDDRWYAIRSLSWSVQPDAPILTVALLQAEHARDVAACARCGVLWPVTLPAPEQGDCPSCVAERALARRRRRRPSPEPPVIPLAGDPPPW